MERDCATYVQYTFDNSQRFPFPTQKNPSFIAVFRDGKSAKAKKDAQCNVHLQYCTVTVCKTMLVQLPRTIFFTKKSLRQIWENHLGANLKTNKLTTVATSWLELTFLAFGLDLSDDFPVSTLAPTNVTLHGDTGR